MLILLFGWAWAYLSVGESLNLVDHNKYQGGMALQSSGGSANVDGHFRMRLDSSSSAHFEVGTGDTDFFTSMALKWVPVPDYKKQPALGVKTGLTFAREKTETFSTINLVPMVSKSFQVQEALLSPYAGINLGFTFGPKNTAPLWLLGGLDLRTDELPRSVLNLEIGGTVREAFSYIQIGFTFEFGS